MAYFDENTTVITGALRRVWRVAGSPTDGTSGTIAGSADPGDMLIDVTNKKIYVNTNTAASPTWSQVVTAGVSHSGDLDLNGDVTLTGDIALDTEDVSVAQGKYVYLDGQGGGEYLRSDTANDLMVNATTNLNLAIGGTDEARLTATVFSPATSDGLALGSTSLMWSDLFLASGGVINFNNGNVTITHDNSRVDLTITGKLNFGGDTDWGVGATGTQITGAGYDWVTQTIGRVNANLNNTAAAAAYHALSITANQTGSNSCFGTWTELYVSNSVDLTGADNFAPVWGQFEAGTGVTLSDTGCFTTGGYFNVKAGATLTVASGHCVNGVRVQAEISAISNSGRLAAFECLKSGGVDWQYGLYMADVATGIHLAESTTDGIVVSDAGWTAGLNNAAIRYGSYTTVKDMDTSGGHRYPVIVGVGVDNAASNTWGCAIFKAVTGVAQTSADVIPILGRTEIDHSVSNARNMQWFITVDNASTNVSGQLSGADFKVDVGSSNSLSGSVYGIQVILDGAATKSSSNDTRLGYFALYANAQADSIIFAQAATGTTVGDLFYGACHNGCDNGLCLNSAGGTMTNAIQLTGTTITNVLKLDTVSCDAYNASFSGSDTHPDGSFQVSIDGHTLHVYCYATPVS